MVWIILIGIVLIMFIILLMLPIKVNINYCYQENNHHIIIQLYYMNVRIMKRKIDLQEAVSNEFSGIDELLQNIQEEDSFWQGNTFIQKIIDLVQKVKTNVRIIIQHITIQKLHWITHFGTGEASSSGTLAGGVWMIKGFLLGILYEQIQFECQPKITVIPYFQQKGLYSEVDCIISIRLGRAIHTALKLVKNMNISNKEVYM